MNPTMLFRVRWSFGTLGCVEWLRSAGKHENPAYHFADDATVWVKLSTVLRTQGVMDAVKNCPFDTNEAGVTIGTWFAQHPYHDASGYVIENVGLKPEQFQAVCEKFAAGFPISRQNYQPQGWVERTNERAIYESDCRAIGD